MELVYLLCSIFTTSLTSLTLSLLLPFRYVIRRLLSPRATPHIENSVKFYQGTVWHERTRPVRHSFQYSVRYALYDLDHAPSDHLSSDQARQYAGTNGPVFLLSIPPSVGYEQNPLSVYYCYDKEESDLRLKKCIAEVTNTPWGERVIFLFDPNSDTVAKPLHVSPFMDMLGNWRIKTNSPGDSLAIAISVKHPELGDYFTATLMAKKVSSLIVGDQALFFWLMPHKVALWIYWHAFKLWWKGVPFVQHPRYSNPEYREEATQKDREVGRKSGGCIGQNLLLAESSTISREFDTNVKDHCFRWRDAKWPRC